MPRSEGTIGWEIGWLGVGIDGERLEGRGVGIVKFLSGITHNGDPEGL